ncbi:extracellular ligand-binding receptor, partial [human gut metagenome]
MGVTCTNPNVTAGNSHYFRICFLDPFQGTVLANYASSELKAKKAYCLGENGNEYDQGLVTFFKQAFEKAGGTVVTDSFPKDNSDFSSYLNKAKDQGCDVFFAPVSIAYSTQLVSQAASLNIGIPFLGSDTWDDNMVLQAAKGTNVQVFVSTFYAEGGNKTFDDGIKAYINGNADAKTTNGGDDTISAVTAMGYDVYYVALEALKAAGSTDPAKVMEALPGVTYDGVSGHIAFDETGDAIRDTAYIKTIDTAANVWKFVTQQ